MLFNSIEFAIFLPIVFLLYWFVFNKSLRLQNLLLVSSSYLFYGWWDWRFLSLIIFSSFVDYIIGIQLSKTDKNRKILLFTSIFVNLGLLGFFKYFNFFAENFSQAFTLLGKPIEVSRLNIILPVGISFYTFQTLSYTIDIYKQKLEPTKDFISFFAFVSFFPQLVAGPIERATNLLPQFYKNRVFDYSKSIDGMRQIIWGLFKKMVIADNAAIYVNDIFANYAHQSSSTLIIGGILFALQIYGDFSGYSDIAIGTSRLFGFDLMKNFAFPYFSRDIAEFWRRWHISLSTWFRDYLYIPLGGNRGNNYKKVRNIFIIFLVSGFWHGANWTFLAWGFLNALYFIPLMILKQNRKNTDNVAHGRLFPNLKEAFQVLITFILTILAWIFFRAETITDAVLYIKSIFTNRIYGDFPATKGQMATIFILILFFVIIEWIGREQEYGLQFIRTKKSTLFRWIFYATIIYLIGMYMPAGETPFIYFQF